MSAKQAVEPARGRLGVLLPGMGAVTSTFVAGLELHKIGHGDLVGSVTQNQTIRLGKRYEGRAPRIRDFVPLAEPTDVVVGGWDIYAESMYEAALHAGVLPVAMLDHVRAELEAIRPMPAVFDPAYVRRLDGPNKKRAATKWDLAQMLVDDIHAWREHTGVERLVMIWCGSTEIFQERASVHEDLEAFEAGLHANDPGIPPSMLYAYAALRAGVPYANGAPNLSADVPALANLATDRGVPIAGKDFKTGQTLLKTIIAPGLKARMLGLGGWYSTNILGNRDGEVLDDPGSFETKERSKLSVLDTILEPQSYPHLYGDYTHKVRIDYYPPRGDAKEGWDNIDIFGWLGLPMQIKLNFLCRDSILAAPIVLDLALFLDLSQRSGLGGIQEWLSFYFKSPQCRADLAPEHDLFIQHWKLKNTLRLLMGETPLDHAGLDYYDPVRGTPPPREAPRPLEGPGAADAE